MAIRSEWIVHTNLDSSTIYGGRVAIKEQGFETEHSAEAFLNSLALGFPDCILMKDRGWVGPIPLSEIRRAGVKNYFSGPWLGELVSFNDQDRGVRSFDEVYEQTWEDLALDDVTSVHRELVAKGIIPEAADLPGPPILTAEQRKMVDQELKKRSLPNITCFLGESWDFPNLQSDARRHLGNINPNRDKSIENQILNSALDLEVVLRSRHPALLPLDIADFWTSLQVWVYVADFCRKCARGSIDVFAVEDARRQFCRALGSYAWKVRHASHTMTSTGVSAHPNETRAKRRTEEHPDPKSILGSRTRQTFQTASEALGLTHRRITQLIEEGKLVAEGRGSARRVTTDSILKYLQLPEKKLEKRSNSQ